MIDLGFINPSGQSVVVEINIFSKDRITKITSFKDGIPTYTKLEGLKFSPAGIVKEFPDLKDTPFLEMRQIALERFKIYLNKMETEKELVDYVRHELEKHGYKLYQIIRPGFRPKRIKHGENI